MRHTSACSIPNSESVRGGDTPRLSERAPLTQGYGAVSAVIGIHASLNVGRCRHGGTDEHVHKGDGGSTRDAPVVPQETRATGSGTNRFTSSWSGVRVLLNHDSLTAYSRPRDLQTPDWRISIHYSFESVTMSEE